MKPIKRPHPDRAEGDADAGFVSVVLPTYREVDNLRALVTRIAEAMAGTGRRYEVIVVDDDSRDGTDALVHQLAAEHYPVRLITRIGERGLSSAVLRGFREAQGDVLVCMDADLSHPPEAIPKLIEALHDAGVELVLGSRYVEGGSTDARWGLVRWLNSRIATILARPFTAVKDPMSGFFAVPRRIVARAERLSPVGYKIALELIVKCRCRDIREVPIHFSDRRFGESKLNLSERFNYLKHLKRLADFKYGTLSRLGQFCFVGATGMGVDLSVLGALLRLSVTFLAARALAIWTAMTWNFFLNRRLTFSYSRLGSVFAQYPRFAASCALGAVISWSVAVGLVKVTALLSNHVFLASIIGIACGTVSNFLFSRYWVFKREAITSERQQGQDRAGR